MAAGEIPKGALITATMTGHGLKDPDIAAYREAVRRSQAHFSAVDSTLQEVEKRYLARR